jgi:hypothetical protein
MNSSKTPSNRPTISDFALHYFLLKIEGGGMQLAPSKKYVAENRIVVNGI